MIYEIIRKIILLPIKIIIIFPFKIIIFPFILVLIFFSEKNWEGFKKEIKDWFKQ